MRRKLLALAASFVLAVGIAGCGDDDDDDTDVASDDTTEETTDETTEETAADDVATVSQEACDGYAAWEQTGDDAELDAVRAWADEAGRDDVIEALDALDTQETDTPDGQAAYEGAVDFIRGELMVGGCELG